MPDEVLNCPNCGFRIAISEVLTVQIRDRLKSELEIGVRKKEAELGEREKQLRRAQELVDEQVAARLKGEITKVRVEAEKKAEDKLRVELADLKDQILQKDKRLSEAQEAELELRKRTRELEERKAAFELEITRKMDAERERIRQEAQGRFIEEHHLKDAEKDKLIKDLRSALEEAKRKAEQGSMQTQGEVLELDLENTLRAAFPYDDVQPVPKGIKGADVIHTVFDSQHRRCGVILWEAKHTKNWSDGWVQKLKDDQREMGADIAVIVTQAMPKDVESCCLLNGVWVARSNLAISLATAFRQQLMEVTFARLSAVGKNEKMEALYQYLSGHEFRQKVEAIVESFSVMQGELEKEKRAMARIWKEREKQIQRIMLNTAGMYGDMRGIIGASLPEVQALELGPVIGTRQLESEGDEDEE